MRMAEVRLQEGESLENALRRFKRKVMTEDIIKDVRRHSFYLKPGERGRVKGNRKPLLGGSDSLRIFLRARF
jgi:small subunit ribosomal protein S21